MLAHLEELGAQVRRMEQRQPGVRYELGALWAKDAAAREKLRKLDEVRYAMRTPCGDWVITFEDGSVSRGATIWEALV